MAFLSVIIPIYNAADYLEEAINSLTAQTFKDIEIICVNDCSKDNSIEILNKLASADSRIVVVNSPVNVGAGGARNLGLDRATGKYITFMDSDDKIEPDLYMQATSLATDEIDQVVWGLKEEHFDKNGKFVRSVSIKPERKVCLNQADMLSAVLELERITLFGYQWNSLYKSEIIKNNNIRVEKTLFYEDYFFNLAFIKHSTTLATLDYDGHHYFKRINGSITNRFTKDYFSLSYRRVKTMFELLHEHKADSDYAKTVLANYLARYTFSALMRNCDKRSKLNRVQRKNFLTEIYNDELFLALTPFIGSKGISGIVYNQLRKRRTALCLMIGRIMYIAKEKMPKLFSAVR